MENVPFHCHLCSRKLLKFSFANLFWLHILFERNSRQCSCAVTVVWILLCAVQALFDLSYFLVHNWCLGISSIIWTSVVLMCFFVKMPSYHITNELDKEKAAVRASVPAVRWLLMYFLNYAHYSYYIQMPTNFWSITKLIKTNGGLLNKKWYSKKHCIHMNKLVPWNVVRQAWRRTYKSCYLLSWLGLWKDVLHISNEASLPSFWCKGYWSNYLPEQQGTSLWTLKLNPCLWLMHMDSQGWKRVTRGHFCGSGGFM